MKIKSAMNSLTACGLVLLSATSASAWASDVPKMGKDGCDIAWERVITPSTISIEFLDGHLAALEKMEKGEVHAEIQQIEEMYYRLARVPAVIGVDGKQAAPTALQRETWFAKAAERGHKSALAGLNRLRYLDPAIPLERRVNREIYLKAARAAAEAGDPEYATVMMDTARNTNRQFHCTSEDRSPDRVNQCLPQSVTRPEETRKWAEIAARGNPHAVDLLCTMHYFGTYPQWGFEKDDAAAVRWCFAAHTHICLGAGGLLPQLLESGRGTPKDEALAKKLREFRRERRFDSR